MKDEAIEAYLARSRVAELEEVLAAPHLEKVRRCLVSLIEGIEVREDGSVWMLVGEGPLGADDLRLLPADTAPKGESTTTGHRRDARDRSLGSMVGATRVAPFKRPVLWRLRVTV